jgi:uncharacterized protein YndB with AHSA1/START domain
MHKDREIHIVTQIHAPVAQVWDLLTNPDRIRSWLSEDGTAQVRSDWKVGSPLHFYGDWHGVNYQDKSTILILEPEKRFQYSYLGHFSGLPDSPENYAILDFQLAADGDTTILTFHAGNLLSREIFGHANLYWRVSLEVIKELAEKKADLAPGTN